MKFLSLSAVFLLIPLLYVFADWPVPKSIKCASTGTFHCKRTGKYEDPFDFTCTKYFLCNEFEHETVEVELECPENTFYDPVNQHCSSEYKCICHETANSITSIPSTPTLPLEIEKSKSYPDECKICSQCITSVGTTVVPSKTTIDTTLSEDISVTPNPTSSTTESTIISPTQTPKYCTHGENFTCTKIGRFANPNDPSCNSYFYCYGWTHDKVGQYLYYCSIGLFNPGKGACDLSYSCPCLNSATTETSAISITTQLPSSIISQSSTQESLSNKTSDVTSTACNLERNFTCTETGRFPNPNDQSCNSYIYCYLWSNGTVSQHVYSCSIGLFNPNVAACDVSYICTCLETNITESEPVSTTTQLSSPTTRQTISSTQESLSTKTSDVTSTACNLERNFTCTETGRFPNPNDQSCNSYIYCYLWSNGTVSQYVYSCSIGLFNPNVAACDVSYICTCLETNITESEPVSTTTQLSSPTTRQTISSTQESLSTKTSDVTSTACNLERNFTCTETGRFPNPNDQSCNSYIYCYLWSNGTVSQYVYACSIGMFNPNVGACDLSYICACLETNITETEPVPTTTQLSSPTTRQASSSTQGSTQGSFTTKSTAISSTTSRNCNLETNFTCLTTGRFANPNDSSCNSYFYCYVYSDGKIGQYLYFCSIGLFNPSKGACDTTYFCPCAETNTPLTSFPISSKSGSTNARSAALSNSNATKKIWPPWFLEPPFQLNQTTQPN